MIITFPGRTYLPFAFLSRVAISCWGLIVHCRSFLYVREAFGPYCDVMSFQQSSCWGDLPFWFMLSCGCLVSVPCPVFSPLECIGIVCALWLWHLLVTLIWAAPCDFQQCVILTSIDSDEPVQPHFKLRNSKRCSVSSLTLIEYSRD